MNLYQRYGLTPIINAAGTFTPLGVSRSAPEVSAAAAEALGAFVVIDELQERVSRVVAELTGAEACTVTHCVAAGITLAVAAVMTGDDAERVAALPDTRGMPDRVVLPAGHAVNYGHPIATDIRLAGAHPVTVGTHDRCTLDQIDAELAQDDTACLLLVSSRLTCGEPIDYAKAVALAHRRQKPVLIDAAAQDLRIDALLATGADLVLISAHKYMASPTAGLVIGRRALVAACRAQEKGIGRAMKATKEALVGVLAALDERLQLDRDAWRDEQARKVARFLAALSDVPGITASGQPDPSGMPFSRAVLTLDSAASASALVETLKAGSPSIRVMEREMSQGRLMFELVPLHEWELRLIVERIVEALAADRGNQPGI